MPLVGVNQEPLKERAIFGFDGADYRVVAVDTAGQLVAALQAGSTITVTQGTAANLKAQVTVAAGQSIEATQATAANLKVQAALAADQNVQARGYGWISAAWQKNPFLIGYSNTVAEQVINTALAAGANTLSTTAVPAGEVHVITNIAIYYVGTVTNVILTVRLNDGAAQHSLFGQRPPATGVIYDRQGYWVLKPGWLIDYTVGAATLNDDAAIFITGFSFDIDQ